MGFEPRQHSWAALLGLLLACHGQPPQASGVSSLTGSKLARVLFPDGRSFLVEVADTPEARARGLMFRDRLNKGEGMLFRFPEPGIHPFWMKNCQISLDILWLDADGRIVHMEKSAPPCKADPCPSIAPLRISTWALEIGAGEAGGSRLGDQLLVGPEHAESSQAPPRQQ